VAVETVEELGGLGSWSVECDWNPEVAAELLDDDHKPRKVHVLVNDPDGNRIYAGVMLKAAGGKGGLRIGGRNLGWWLESAPLIADRDYLSGANKLSDDHFQLDISETASGFLWDFANNSKWQILGAPEAIDPPGNVAATFGYLDQDDILRSTESFPTKAGHTYYATALIQLKGQVGPGQFRLRTVFTGRFQNPDLSSPYTSWSAAVRGDIHYETDPQGIVAGPVLRIQTALPNIIPNGGFDDGAGSLNGFIQFAGAWALASDGGHNGVHYVHTDNGPAFKELVSSADGAVALPAIPQPVVAGEKYRMWMVARTNPASPATDGETKMQAGITGAIASFVPTPTIKPDNGVGNWQLSLVDVTIPDGMTALTPQIVVTGQTTGRWDFDDVTLIRTAGNWDSVTGPQVFGTPGRTYRWSIPYRVDTSVTEGIVTMRAACRGPAVPLLILDGTSIATNVDAPPGVQRAIFDITLPSGYDSFVPTIYVADVHGGAFFLGRGTIVDTDDKTSVADVYSRPPDMAGYGTIAVASTAPTGAETVHVELVAEANSGQWIVGQVGLKRTDLAPATGNAIVAALLAGTSVVPGVVNCPETIPYDWTIRNLSPWEALVHYCTVISSPKREFRINPDNTIDVGTAATVFTDHSPSSPSPITLVAGDIDVEPLPDVETDLDERAQVIKVIGAERQRTGAQTPILISATAAVLGTAPTDWFGATVRRVKVVSDGTVDHWTYAQALADDLAARESEPVLSVPAKLTPMAAATTTALDVPPRPSFGVGDWLYVYDPDNGLSDTAYTDDINGEAVHPRRLRVVNRTRQLGPGCTVTIRRLNGSTFDLASKAGIRWSDKDETAVTLGQRPPDFLSDPQGGNAAGQYLRDRASRPR